MLVFLCGLLLGLVIGFCLAVRANSKNERDKIKAGVFEKNGTAYTIKPL